MQLSNLNIISQSGLKAIHVENGKIISITNEKESKKSNSNQLSLSFENAMAFPGLINSHDHLDFNLFPQLKNRVYNNYTEWGRDIHQSYKTIIEEILNIPKKIRFQWGIYKNTLNGITTVIEHGSKFHCSVPIITVCNNAVSYHSVSGEKFWKLKLNSPFKPDLPIVFHVGEGTDDSSFKEINTLIKWNLFKRKLIGVHGVSMSAEQAKSFDALIWCPDSNFFLLNKTARIDELKKKTNILFGTDSTVSANWSLWDQIRLAQKTKMLTDTELFDSLTTVPARIWNLTGSGILQEGANADIVIAKMKDQNNPMKSFFQLNPEDILLVIRNGEIIYFDEVLNSQLIDKISRKEFSKIFITGTSKYVIGPLTELIRQIKKYLPTASFPIEIE